MNPNTSPSRATLPYVTSNLPRQQTYQPQKSSPCSCRITQHGTYLHLHAVQVFFGRRAVHELSCPHRNEEDSWAVGIRILQPAIEFALKAHFSRSSASISAALSPHNVVNRSRSPAFIAIHNARKNLFYLLDDFYEPPSYTPEVGNPQRRRYGELAHDGYWFRPGSDHDVSLICWDADYRFSLDVRAIIELLYERLLRAFESGKASPRDQDAGGSTLIHVSITCPLPSTGC